MRIWDLSPGYLNRQSLLGEHRELHGVVSIIKNHKRGYSKHPETLRWVNYGWALKQRHKLLVAEMKLRGYIHKTPVLLRRNQGEWPEIFIDTPSDQISILKDKYKTLEHGRIPLPKNAQIIWSHHKYSIMARDIATYKSIGRWVTTKNGLRELDSVALELTTILRHPPESQLIENTLLHMWGYVSQYTKISNKEFESLSNKALLAKIQKLALENDIQYLTESTSLSELDGWSI